MRKMVFLTLVLFAVAAFAGCGKKAPPQPPDSAARAAVHATAPPTI